MHAQNSDLAGGRWNVSPPSGSTGLALFVTALHLGPAALLQVRRQNAGRWSGLAAGVLITGLLLMIQVAGACAATPVTCNGGTLPQQALLLGGGGATSQPDLVVSGPCTVPPGTYYYGNINIVQTYDDKGTPLTQGELNFTDAKDSTTDFWASSIIVENGGTLTAGVVGEDGKTSASPFGSDGGVLTIHLYGADLSNGNPNGQPGQGALCLPYTAPGVGPCGIPLTTWNDNGKTNNLSLPGGVFDYFYQYGPLMYDTAAGPQGPGYFGYKVLAVCYGGTLKLRGFKGTTGDAQAPTDPLNSGTSWVRLMDKTTLAGYYPSQKPGDTSLTLERPVEGDWKQGDQIVVTTTDYLPGHSEQLTIDTVKGATITFHRSDCSAGGTSDPSCPGLKWPHNGTRYPLADKVSGAGLDTNTGKNRLGFADDLMTNGAETRAAVALLTRSIRIVSAGDAANLPFGQHEANGPIDPHYYFGGHTIFRQGFAAVQVQGVEFYQMGQGGRIMHYPVHFHETRLTPANTYVVDSSVHDSMTRWYVVHSTLGVELARNVGYLSIGHGYYLEDATETNNKFYSNIGIFARAAVDNLQNPRKVPGILADNAGSPAWLLRGTSDYNYPSVFWITNGWNDFQGNMAAGAGTCGACYWFAPAFNADMRDVPPMSGPMTWAGYSALQRNVTFQGTTPLKSFYKNYCTAAMNSFNTVSSAPNCYGVKPADTPTPGYINAVKSIAPTPLADNVVATDPYYPHFNAGGSRLATICPAASTPWGADCSGVTEVCANGSALQNCSVTVLDHYTTSFNWADYNFAAIWLRPQWYLLDNSIISDVQNSGLTFVTGGDYSRSSVIEGYWSLASHSALIGMTQPTNPLASDAGPFSTASGIACVYADGNHCLNIDEGVSIQLAAFAVEQRLFSIYDGPGYQDSNAYLDITTTPCPDFADCMYYNLPGVRKNPIGQPNTGGYLPNAAIGWKQPNGFYYPPAFHSDNMFFNNVDIRHYVNIPLFLSVSQGVTPEAGTYITSQPEELLQYINPGFTFTGFTDIDRQTLLNDDDGSLGGLISSAIVPETIMFNNDPTYSAPVETAECKSNIGVDPTSSSTCPPMSPTPPTAVTSPYDIVTTAIAPGCAAGGGAGACGTEIDSTCSAGRCPTVAGRGGQWSSDCSGPFCYGVRLFRQFLTGSNTGAGTREWAQWLSKTNQCNVDPSTAKCQFPFIRMGTQNTWQRSAMTVNNGAYYIDTTVSQTTQKNSRFNDPTSGYSDCSLVPSPAPCQQLSVNTFVGGQTYYIYFIYAKGTTHQVYQMYVGGNFDPDTGVQAVRMNIDTGPYTPTGASVPWDSTGWTRTMIAGPDGKTDILQVTVDFKNFAAELNPTNTGQGGTLTNPTCKPASFCSWNGSSCSCSMAANDPRLLADPGLKASCDHACNVWAVKDLDCPPAGCLAFAVTLPSTFVAADQYERPTPTPFPTTDPTAGWTAVFKNTSIVPDSKSGGTCYYASLPNNCPNPN